MLQEREEDHGASIVAKIASQLWLRGPPLPRAGCLQNEFAGGIHAGPSIVDLWLAEMNCSGRAEMSKQRQKEQKGTKMGDSKWHGVDANNPFALPDQGSCIDKILTEDTRPGLEGPWHLSG